MTEKRQKNDENDIRKSEEYFIRIRRSKDTRCIEKYIRGLYSGFAEVKTVPDTCRALILNKK